MAQPFERVDIYRSIEYVEIRFNLMLRHRAKWSLWGSLGGKRTLTLDREERVSAIRWRDSLGISDRRAHWSYWRGSQRGKVFLGIVVISEMYARIADVTTNLENTIISCRVAILRWELIRLRIWRLLNVNGLWPSQSIWKDVITIDNFIMLSDFLDVRLTLTASSSHIIAEALPLRLSPLSLLDGFRLSTNIQA